MNAGRGGRALTRWLPALLSAISVIAIGFSGLGRPLGIPDTMLHVAAWTLLGALTAAALHRTRPDVAPARRALAAAAVVIAFGALDELAQTWAPLRSAQWGDLLADAVGGTLGATMYALVAWRRARSKLADESSTESR